MNKQKIEFFAWPNDKGITRIDAGLIRHTRLEEFYDDNDTEKIDSNWQAQLAAGNFRNLPMGSLWNTRQENSRIVASYLPTEYKVYNAVAFPHNSNNPPSYRLRSLMRISSVGGVIFTSDDKILMQKRAEGVTAAGLIDSVVAGFCVSNDKNKLDFDCAIKEKLKREAVIDQKEVSSLEQRSLFSSIGYDFSGMIGYLVKTTLSSQEIALRANKKYIGSIYALKKNEIFDFIARHYIKEQDMTGDGCAVLLSCLEQSEFEDVVEEIKSRGAKIQFGQLSEGKFIPN
ncbi:MAG: hypothetical protein AABX85_01550 [Nanoarchaeota archaeon]